jgi:rSAM/selenodomain-associated transferase 1
VSDRAIAIFAKAAQPGRVKTRLMPALSAESAADLALAFLRDTVETMQGVAPSCDATPIVLFAPGDTEPWFRTVLGPDVRLLAQSDGDLTKRLQVAYCALAQAGFSRVCFVGTDSPTIPPALIERAFSLLEDHDVVIGPATDGGYYLIALRAEQYKIFEGIEWSTSAVLQQTRAAASALQLRVALLPEWYDIDDVASLERLRGETNETVAPHTSAVLATIDL